MPRRPARLVRLRGSACRGRRWWRGSRRSSPTARGSVRARGSCVSGAGRWRGRGRPPIRVPTGALLSVRGSPGHLLGLRRADGCRGGGLRVEVAAEEGRAGVLRVGAVAARGETAGLVPGPDTGRAEGLLAAVDRAGPLGLPAVLGAGAGDGLTVRGVFEFGVGGAAALRPVRPGVCIVCARWAFRGVGAAPALPRAPGEGRPRRELGPSAARGPFLDDSPVGRARSPAAPAGPVRIAAPRCGRSRHHPRAPRAARAPAAPVFPAFPSGPSRIDAAAICGASR